MKRKRSSPFKASTKKRSPYKTYKRRKMNNKIKKIVKQTVMRQAETKYVSTGQIITSCYHNIGKKIAVWEGTTTTSIWPSQGDGERERVGNEIQTTGIMIRGAFEVPHDRRNTKFKLWLVEHNSQQGDPSVRTNLQYNTNNNGMLDPVKKNVWGRGLTYLGQYKCQSADQNTGTMEDKTILMKRWIPFKRKIRFLSDGSKVPVGGCKENCFLVLIPYDSYGTLETDIIVTTADVSFTLYYKDV